MSFGSRRSSVISSYGNTPTVIRRSFSSSGMLEYSIEQVGAHKLKDSHVLPSITKEEKENEDQEVCVSLTSDNVAEKQLKEVTSDLHKIDHDSSLKNDPVVEDDPDFNSKNHKIFHHYDIPPVRKPSLPQKLQDGKEARKETTLNGSFTDINDAQDMPQILNQKENEKTKDHLKNNSPTEKDHSQKISEAELETKIELSSLSLLPRISSASESEESENAKLKIDIPDDCAIKGDKVPITLLPTPEALERTASINEKTSNAFPRKTFSRFSLRDLPLRSPTPPKKSPRKISKNVFKERDAVKEKASSPQQNENLKSQKHSEFTLSPHSLPSLDLGTRSNSTGNGNVQKNNQSHLSQTDSKIQSVKTLDETPLFIVENEDYDKPSTISPRIGIHNLVSDGKLSKNFIVVHPTSDSNSLGLAPLSAASAAASLKKKATTSSESSARTHSFSSNSANGPKTFLLYRNQTTSTKLKTLRNTSHKEETANTRNTRKSEPSQTMKRSSQVQLLRFTKSTDEESSFSLSSPGTTNSPPLSTNFQASKVQIWSFPLDTSYEKAFSLDITKDFVETNSSRLCSVM